jgi:predicted nucleic acid-binding protein
VAVLPEVDHLLGERLGAKARTVFCRGLAEGYYFVADLPREQYVRVGEVNRRFSELELGFVDAAVVAIAEALGLPRIATTGLRDLAPLARALSLELLP